MSQDQPRAAQAPSGGDGRPAARFEGDVERLVEQRMVPAWRRVTNGENRLPVVAALLVALALQVTLTPQLGIRPRWLLPVLEVVLLVVLSVINPIRLTRGTRLGRYASLALVLAITVDNTTSAVLLDKAIITGNSSDDAIRLLASAASIYLTNVIAFGIWYWELDRGGPFARAAATRQHPDFLFPQMTSPELTDRNWEPLFADYLYVSFTNATAFSPTDTMPMSRWAKGFMALQAAVALSTTALVISRAISVLR